VTLAWYPNVGANNADLPVAATPGEPGWEPSSSADLAGRPTEDFAALWASHSLILAPTELSATAPLKIAARAGGFRAATMPGFLPSMIPALKLDYAEINRRVQLLKECCDEAHGALVITETGAGMHEFFVDLRHRKAHASGGLFPRNGVAGNLPSGEAYIVPYEGEIAGDESRTAGVLPVQLGDSVALLQISENRVRSVAGEGALVDAEREHFEREPAYANIAELGLGVLGDFGLKPTGSILLDEKLGLHIAFGRSDHFGGIVGPDAFTAPAEVIHLDRVYIPEVQPLVKARELQLHGPKGPATIMIDGRFAGIF
jgi:leucyl aminopeptidase (aminopeptidase T)